MTLLFRNYNSIRRDDVLFFHTGDIPLTAQADVLALCAGSRARFLQLDAHHFQTPHNTPPESTWRYAKKFSAGYRHMIRFFTSGLWHVLAREGYTHVMRFDEDSFLWSPIRYNIFEFMAKRGLDYGYRLASLERDNQAEKLHSYVREYAQRRGVIPTWLLHSCRKPASLSNFTLRQCGDTYNIYNNWFVTRVGFWLSDDVQQFLAHVNRSHVIYTERWGDLLWQSMSLQLFMDRDRVHMFNDFSYEHATISTVPFPANPTWKQNRLTGLNRTCLAYGGIVLGGEEADLAPARERLRDLASTPLCRHYRDGRYVMRPCIVHQPSGRVTSYLLGSVSTVQARCDRKPAPIYCNSTAAAALRVPRRGESAKGIGHVNLGYRQVQASLGGLCCCHDQRSSKFFAKASQVLGVQLRGVSLATHRTAKEAAAYGAKLANESAAARRKIIIGSPPSLTAPSGGSTMEAVEVGLEGRRAFVNISTDRTDYPEGWMDFRAPPITDPVERAKCIAQYSFGGKIRVSKAHEAMYCG